MILAQCILRLVISGTGTKARQTISLFNTISGKASCINDNGTIMVYEKNEVIDMNKRAKVYIENEMEKRNYKISSRLNNSKFVNQSYKNLQTMIKQLDTGNKSIKKTIFNSIKKTFFTQEIQVDDVAETAENIYNLFEGDEEKRNINKILALTAWLAYTDVYIDSSDVLGFILHIGSDDFTTMLIEPIRI